MTALNSLIDLSYHAQFIPIVFELAYEKLLNCLGVSNKIEGLICWILLNFVIDEFIDIATLNSKTNIIETTKEQFELPFKVSDQIHIYLFSVHCSLTGKNLSSIFKEYITFSILSRRSCRPVIIYLQQLRRLCCSNCSSIVKVRLC